MTTQWRAIWILARRELVGFARQPSRWAAAIGTPLLFWLVLGAGLGTSLRIPSAAASGDSAPASAMAYFFPGALLMVILFSSVFGAISLIEDRREGFLQGVLVAPVRRVSIVAGKVLGSTLLATLQGALLLLAVPLAGVPLAPGTLLATLGALALASLALSALGVAFAWRIDSVQGFHGVMNIVLFPMWLLSGALFPPEGANRIMRAVMAVNPLTYDHALLRQTLGLGAGGYAGGWLSATVAMAFALGTLFFAWRMACRTMPT